MSDHSTGDGDVFQAMRQADQERRRSLHDATAATLAQHKVPFVTKNQNVFLVKSNRPHDRGRWFYYWPPCSKWRSQGRGKTYQSANLLSFLSKYMGYEIAPDDGVIASPNNPGETNEPRPRLPQ